MSALPEGAKRDGVTKVPSMSESLGCGAIQPSPAAQGGNEEGVCLSELIDQKRVFPSLSVFAGFCSSPPTIALVFALLL